MYITFKYVILCIKHLNMCNLRLKQWLNSDIRFEFKGSNSVKRTISFSSKQIYFYLFYFFSVFINGAS